MSLIRRKQQSPAQPVTFVKLKDAAEMLQLDESTIRKGRAGTDVLTLVRQGTGKRQRVFLVLEEIEAYKASLVEHALAQKAHPLKLVYGT